jgi:cysteinyl-tRNA synthetase
MQLYNALTQRKETFTPAGDTVTVYVCGITPYDTTHLGHCFTYASFDVLIRYLEYEGTPVKYVQNVTDVDDDILRKAQEVEGDWKAIGDRWTAHFIKDMRALNIRPPEHFPRATDVIEEMTEVVQTLLDAGYAYERKGNVYFHVDSWEEFGKLSRIPRQEMLPVANERGNHPDDPHKKDPLDFVLWQAQAPGEPAWDSPWGPGRPGWHIECSTMATTYLGNTIDIHGGGADLIFPHHECEIAQSECSTGQQPFVRLWMHNGFVTVDEEKMAKSLGNFLTIRDLLIRYRPEEIRYFILSSHYRSPLAYSDEQMAGARGALTRLYTALRGIEPAAPAEEAPQAIHFAEAMGDDFNTPEALAALFDLAREINRLRDTDRQRAASMAGLLRHLGGAIGLLQDNPEAYLQGGAGGSDDAADIEARIEARRAARQRRDFAEADRIRDELAAEGIQLEDGPEGTTWRRVE